MGYAILYEAKANRILRRLPANIRQKLLDKIELLAENPEAPNANVKKLRGKYYKDICRLRVADWRIFYRVKQQQIQIIVLDISSRGDAYKH